MQLCWWWWWLCCNVWALTAVAAAAADETRSPHRQQQQRTLSRKRRYLIFPEGSSFQLGECSQSRYRRNHYIKPHICVTSVYDQIIPIVDYTNLFIFGVTTALAWPLPDTPIDDAKLRDMFANGTVPFRRIDDDADYADVAAAASAELSTDARIQDAYYASRPPPNAPPRLNQLYDRDDRYYASDRRQQQLINRFAADDGAPFRPWTAGAGWSEHRPAQPAALPPPPRRHHRIYPALGKRSIRSTGRPTTDRPIEHLSLMLHRSTRHTLYDRVERYLEAHGQPGDACVRRALCETSRRQRSDREPGSFVGELMRVVFSLPDVAQHAVDHERLRREDAYHEAAHGGEEGVTCAVRYAACEASVWESVYTV